MFTISKVAGIPSRLRIDSGRLVDNLYRGNDGPSVTTRCAQLFRQCAGAYWSIATAVWDFCERCSDSLLTRLSHKNKLERTLAGLSGVEVVLPSGGTHLAGAVDNVIIESVKRLLESRTFAKSSGRSSEEIRDFLESSLTDGKESSLDVTLAQEKARHLSSQLLPKNSELHDRCTEVLVQIQKARHCRAIIETKRREAFEISNAEHVEVLRAIWTNLMTASVPPPPLDRVSAAERPTVRPWTDVGFQSTPGSDFRGAGFLGALNLKWFTEKHIYRARQILNELNSETDLWFPFAATGLNITMWVCRMLDDGILDPFFYGDDTLWPVDVSSVVYSFVFLEFYRFWRLSRPKNILQFGEVSARFLPLMRRRLAEFTNPASHTTWGVPAASGGRELVEELQGWTEGSFQSRSASGSRHVVLSSSSSNHSRMGIHGRLARLL